MIADVSAGNLIRIGSGLLLSALGVFCLSVRPATARARYLGTFLLSYGFALAMSNLEDLPAAVGMIGLAAYFVAALAALLFIRLVARDRWTTFLMIAFASVGAGVLVVVATRDVVAGAAYYGMVGLLGGALVALARRARAVPAERVALALTGVGLGIYPALESTWDFWAELAPRVRVEPLLGVLIVPAALAWSLAARDGKEGHAAARNVALALTGAALLGISYPSAAALDFVKYDMGLEGIARLLSFATLAWAIFRHDLLGTGLDAVTARRGAVAAAFLAVLFIVAEGLQSVLSATFGLLAGALVAGLVLFAARPIERALERGRGAHPSIPSPEHAYRLALRAALVDGVLTDEEHDHLAALAQHLGIGAADARRLQKEEEVKRKA